MITARTARLLLGGWRSRVCVCVCVCVMVLLTAWMFVAGRSRWVVFSEKSLCRMAEGCVVGLVCLPKELEIYRRKHAGHEGYFLGLRRSVSGRACWTRLSRLLGA